MCAFRARPGFPRRSRGVAGCRRAIIVGPTFMVGRILLIVPVVAMLLLATSTRAHSAPMNPQSEALQSMQFMVGAWHCSEHIVGGTDRAYSMTVTSALSGSWMKSETEYSAVGRAPAWREESYWTYIPLTMGWTLKTFDSGGNYGDFGAKWWKGSTIVWHGRRIIKGHTNDRAFEWMKSSSTRFEIHEYDSDADGHRVTLMSSASCGKSG
jgi:hypothetical protein